MIRAFLLVVALAFAAPAAAQTYPALTGRVVDAAGLLTPAQEAALNQRLDALQRASSRQLVVATLPDLQGRSIEEYGVGLGRAWHIGQQGADNGVVLIVAVAERKVRIEVGYGLEGILTDALTSRIIRDQITPHFRADDYPGGINAGVDAIVEQLQAPPEAAEQRVAAAAQAENAGHARRGRGGSPYALMVWGLVFLFVLIPLMRSGFRGRRYRGPWGTGRVSTWGPGGGGGSGLGWMLAGMFLGGIGRRGRYTGGDWGGGGWGGGGGGFGGGGGGGFSGGGGSFGGGGASGGW